MLLQRLLQENLTTTYSYLDRYVNDGSPSGFTELHQTSSSTSPFSHHENFNVPILKVKQIQTIQDFGNHHKLNSLSWLQPDEFLIHPDLIVYEEAKEYFKNEGNSIKVSPTASSRTVLFEGDEKPWYLKLHYQGLIGRIRRELPYDKAISGVEVSNELVDGISRGLYPPFFRILPEVASRTVNLSSNKSWSFVLREYNSFGLSESDTLFIVPYFSLFSKDRNSPNDKSLLEQMGNQIGPDNLAELVTKFVLKRLIEVHFQLIMNQGFQMEHNAQNVSIGFNKDLVPTCLIYKDLMGIEKDHEIRAMLGLENKFASYPYKALLPENQEKNRIRHSFSYDFKLGEYMLSPVIKELCQISSCDEPSIVHELRSLANTFISQLPSNFFPENGDWYCHDNVMLDQTRIYRRKANPKYR